MRVDFLDLLPDAALLVAAIADGARIRYANPQASQMFGYDCGELTDRPVELLIPERFADQHRRHRRGYAQAPRMRVMGSGLRLLGRHRDGSEFPVAVQLNACRDGPDPSVLVVVRDMTAHERMESALVNARDVALRANESKSRFLAAASHDLRQPLQTIESLQSILGRELKDTALAPHVELLKESVRAMDQILSSLVDINRLEKGAIAPIVRDFPLREILPRLRSQFGYSASSKSLALEIDESGECARSDPMLLLMVLRNLIGNAVKYTQQGFVRLRTRTQGSDLFIDVMDSGPGIPPEHMGRLFEAFYQIDNPSHDQRHGVGLGLSIVQNISRLLEHTVTVESTVGQGTTFTLQLPRGIASVPAETAPPRPRPAAPRVPAGSIVLHVEDEPGVAASMAMLLQLEGYTVISAASRDEAVDHIRGRGVRPDLILCDYQLPMGFTGDQILAELRAILQVNTPTILLTGDIAQPHLEKAKAMADRIMPKPVDVNLLLIEMAELLGRSAGSARSDASG